MKELRRLVALKDHRNTGRDIELDQIFGMREAVQWAHSSIRDVNAWRRGEISWSAVDHAVCLVGPPGTGKTLFASAYAKAAGAKLIACSLARWQGSDEGHLGHLLRAMRKDFAEARAQAPCVLFVDEIDSFADRSKVRHSHADYAVQVVNAFLAELDGLAGRDGLLFCAASNDVSRCDPAILRPGRFSKVIRIGLPDADELERMFRVRLRGELATARLDDICLLGMGSTGADVERIVADARRFARQDNRDIELADLRRALTGDRDRDQAELERAAVHEAGHLLAEMLLFGEVDCLFAHIAASGDRGGATIRTRTPALQGTYEDYSKRLQVLLAGRVAEKMIFHAYSDGGGGRKGSDLDQGTRLATAMVASLGLVDTSLLFLGSREDTRELLSYPEVRRAARTELTRAADACRSTLIEHRESLERIAAVLLKNGSLDGVRAAKFLSGNSASWSVAP
ncbi:AAA family ATPase [Bradyrhizobium sp. UFLA01-814]|uniref:AAA family ATPase n=1 Tax=Bradyrhizobium sp. UFLA01-814 TaxID=3023480 RepID=UPI00398BA8E8